MIVRTLATFLLCWTVTATPARIIDGDTFSAKLDIWLGLYTIDTIRVLGVDTHELSTGQPGADARNFTQAWLMRGDVTVTACKRDSFGRLLGKVSRNEEDLADVLIKAGHGVKR